MSRLLNLDLKQGGSVLVEVDEAVRGAVTRGGKPAETVTKVGETFDEVLGQLAPVVRSIVAQLRAAASEADQIEVEFGVKLSTDANVIIARMGGEANLRVGLRWTLEGPGRQSTGDA